MKLRKAFFFSAHRKVACFLFTLLFLFVSFSYGFAQDTLTSRIDVIKKHAIPFDFQQPTSKIKELHFLKQFIGNSSIVAIGEQTHGTSEFFQVRFKIIRDLISNHGFTVIALEAPIPETALLDSYILTGKGNPREILKTFYLWSWETQEMLDMLEWMKEYNLSHKEKIHLTGFDFQSPFGAIAHLKDYAKTNQKELLPLLDSLKNTIQKLNMPFFSHMLDEAQWKAIHADYTPIINALEKQSKFKLTPTNKETLWLQQNLEILKQAMYLNNPEVTQWNVFKVSAVRDSLMAKNVQWLLQKYYPQSKIILLGHNGHVQKAPNRFSKTLGYHLSLKNSNYKVIGLATNTGSYTAYNQTANGISGNNELKPSTPSSWEYYFSQVKEPAFFLPLKDVSFRDKSKLLQNQKLLFRFIGMGAETTQFYPSNLLNEFDAIIYVDKTNASKNFYVKQR